MAEKLRSLFERTRARDVYDVWFISKNIDMGKAFEIFPAKCEFKKLSPDINYMLHRKQDFQNAWKSSLGHQLKGLPDFDMIFNEVTDIIASSNMQKTPPSAAPHRGLGSQPQRRDDKGIKSKKHRASKYNSRGTSTKKIIKNGIISPSNTHLLPLPPFFPRPLHLSRSQSL